MPLSHWKTRLILVDGLPGTGKSTITQLLFLHLAKLGLEASWFHEEETEHPIHQPQTDASLEDDLGRWQELVNRLEGSSETLLLDGTIFQNSVGWLLAMGFDETAINDYVEARNRIIAPLEPALLYLRHGDVSTVMTNLFKQRGDEWKQLMIERMAATPYGKKTSCDLDGLLVYFTELQNLTDRIAVTWPWSRCTPSTRSWDERHLEITEHLELPPFGDIYRQPDHVDELAGTYREQSGQFQWRLSYDGEDFYIDDQPRTLLRHKEDNTFYASGSCIELIFDRNGDQITMTCAGNHPDWEGIGTRWTKIKTN